MTPAAELLKRITSLDFIAMEESEHIFSKNSCSKLRNPIYISFALTIRNLQREVSVMQARLLNPVVQHCVNNIILYTLNTVESRTHVKCSYHNLIKRNTATCSVASLGSWRCLYLYCFQNFSNLSSHHPLNSSSPFTSTSLTYMNKEDAQVTY